MALADTTTRLLGLAETLHRWLATLVTLDTARREKVALYADEIAETLARAGAAVTRLETSRADRAASRELARELGRIAGYIETVMDVLRHHLDGRKLAGVKRRLEQLGQGVSATGTTGIERGIEADRLFAAEGYFRALADRLRA